MKPSNIRQAIYALIDWYRDTKPFPRSAVLGLPRLELGQVYRVKVPVTVEEEVK